MGSRVQRWQWSRGSLVEASSRVEPSTSRSESRILYHLISGRQKYFQSSASWRSRWRVWHSPMEDVGTGLATLRPGGRNPWQGVSQRGDAPVIFCSLMRLAFANREG